MLRWLLILSLACQPLTLQAIGASRGATAECREPSCCSVVETVTCCGQRVVERVCDQSGGECRCAAVPGDSDPASPAPMPRSGDEAAPVFAAAMSAYVVLPPRAPRGAERAAIAVPLTTAHNRARALLGNWRT